MKEKKLLQAFGDVNEGYIEEMYATVPQKRKPKLKVLWAVAAALCAIALLTGAAWNRIYWATNDLDQYPLVDPTQVADEAIRLTVKEVTASSLRVYCTIDGVEYGKDSIYILEDGPFTIEKKTEDGWEALPTRFTDSEWKATRVLTDGDYDWPVNWSGSYGVLEPGTYRYQTVVLEGKAPSGVEFTVTDNEKEEVVALLRTALDSSSYCVRNRVTVETSSLEHLNATDRAGIEAVTQDSVLEYWKHGDEAMKLTYVEGKLVGGFMHKNGLDYYLMFEDDASYNPILGWSRWTELKRDRLFEWAGLILSTGEYEPEYELRSAADGSGMELVSVEERTYEEYGVTAIWTSVWAFDISDPGACAAKLEQQDVNAAPSFSWNLEQQNREPKTVTYVNTAPQPVTTAPEAVVRALAEYSGDYTRAIVYRDEAAGIWKVEFQRDYGYQGYHFVYLNDNGITQMIAEGEPKEP